MPTKRIFAPVLSMIGFLIRRAITGAAATRHLVRNRHDIVRSHKELRLRVNDNVCVDALSGKKTNRKSTTPIFRI